MAFGITDLRKGTLFKYNNQVFKVIDYTQKVVGRGGSIVNVRIKNLLDGKLSDKTFKSSDQIEPADVQNKTVQYLYSDGRKLFFMDQTSYEQFELSTAIADDQMGYIKEGDQVQLLLIDSTVASLELPKNVALKVVYTENVVKGDTTSSVLKNAELETGINVKVPAFIKQGDIISVDTTSGAYRERQK